MQYNKSFNTVTAPDLHAVTVAVLSKQLIIVVVDFYAVV